MTISSKPRSTIPLPQHGLTYDVPYIVEDGVLKLPDLLSPVKMETKEWSITMVEEMRRSATRVFLSSLPKAAKIPGLGYRKVHMLYKHVAAFYNTNRDSFVHCRLDSVTPANKFFFKDFEDIEMVRVMLNPSASGLELTTVLTTPTGTLAEVGLSIDGSIKVIISKDHPCFGRSYTNPIYFEQAMSGQIDSMQCPHLHFASWRHSFLKALETEALLDAIDLDFDEQSNIWTITTTKRKGN